ncbi:MAG: alpha/beta fold hydrolase [Maricaulaceae bacterium]
MGQSKHFEPADIVRPNGRPLPPELEKRAQFINVPHAGVNLRAMLVTAASDHPRGSIIFCPGRTEFIEKYFESVVDFITRGFNVLVVDPRGQGLSDRLLDDPIRSYVADFQDYADDLAFVADELSPMLPKPHIYMGHSMGGCVVLQAVISGVASPSAIVCSAPMLGLYDVSTPILTFMIKAFATFGLAKNELPMQKGRNGLPVPFPDNKLTSDKTRYENWAAYFRNEPRIRLGPPTYGWIAEGLKAMRFVNKNADKVKIPTLIVAAGGDPIVDPTSNREFAEAAGAEFVTVPSALHELFLERDELRDQFYKAFDEFMERHGL